MPISAHKTLILACGALAREITQLQKILPQANFDLQCLPADYHNRPEKIVPALKAHLEARAANYKTILIGYGDCGTGGSLDRLLVDYPHATRLSGAHCYEFFTGQADFETLMAENIGRFFLTDYLTRHFDTVIIKGLGLDRFPHLQAEYFKNYTELVYLSQIDAPALVEKARQAARQLGLDFLHKPVGLSALEHQMQRFRQFDKEPQNA